MNNSRPIRALARGLEVIDVLNSQHTTSVCALCEQTGMSRATLMRILKTLELAGWVYRYRVNGDYRLTSKVCLLGEHLLTLDRLAETAAPFLDRLHQRFHCPSEIAVLAGQEMRVLDSTRRQRSRTYNADQDASVASLLCSAAGRAYLAYCSSRERREIIEQLSSGVRDGEADAVQQPAIEGLVAEIRRKGYAMSGPEHCKIHRGCGEQAPAVAVPVRPNGQVRACLGLDLGALGSTAPWEVREVLPALTEAAHGIAEDLRRLEHA